MLVAGLTTHPAWARVPVKNAHAEAQPAPAPVPAPAIGADKTVQRLAPPLGCDRLTIGDGLPNSNVRAIAQDHRGFIWMGTQDGLVRYDGIEMRIYRTVETDPTSLSSGYITALAVDDSGSVWVGTAEHGVNLYDPNTDTFTRFGKGALSSEGVTAIAKDRKNRMWFAMSGGGLNRFEPASRTFTPFLGKPLDTAITALDADPVGNLWLGTASDGVIRWNPEGNSSAIRPTPGDDTGLGSAPITAILAGSSGKIWIGSDGEGLIGLEPATGKLTHFRNAADDPASLSDNHLSVLFEDRSKNLWIGTTDGLNKMAPSGRIVQYQNDRNDPSSLAFHGVESIYQDQGGVMWIGGFTVGVCKFNEFRINFGYHHTANLATSFFEDPDGALWVGTYNDGLYKYERAAQRVTVYHALRNRTDGKTEPVTLESGTWISALYRDRRGTLWISLKGHGLLAFDTHAETFREFVPDAKNPKSLPSDSIFDLWEDDQGKLWLATWGAGLVRFDPKLEVFTTFTADDSSGLSSDHLYRLYPDPKDKKILWLGTGKGGVVRFNIASGTATSFRSRPDDPTSLSSDDVLAIYREPGGTVWLGTYGGGLDRLDPETGKVQRFTTGNSGLTNNVILGLLPDDEGKLWIGTNGGGLVQFDPKTGTFLVYDSSDGVQDNEFNQGSFRRSASGELFFGGPGGFNAFFPRDIKRDTYVPPVVMTTFKVFNQEVKLDRPIWTLPALEVSYSDSFALQFAALAFAAPRKNRYAYKLEGFDDKFIETDRPYAVYTKLSGGNYTLKVRAANRHGVWNETAIALKLAVTPPLWRTWRAYVVYLMLLAGAAYLLYSLQRQRVLRAEREGRLAVVERDLELTGAVQSGFLPEHNEISTSRVQLFGLYRPADACGGDWWWHEPLSGGRHVVMVGDVTGHGPGPAMVTAAVATAFRVLMDNGLDDVRHGLEMLNREVLRVAKGKYHMTMAALELEESTGWWVFHSAGAPPILSLNQNGKHKVHFCAGAPLGTEIGFETGRIEGQFEPFDRILLYTDGIPEIAAANGNVFGMRRFAQLFERTRAQSLRDSADTILLHADEIIKGQPQVDDWTFAIVEWTPGQITMTKP
ncbi:MAG TPA: two-component regulator propeller domain-containing protein [Kofleriaceae bacterium]|nr:two-component regulator propeller domain-containing protein [Kofleriaceae bacterium]